MAPSFSSSISYINLLNMSTLSIAATFPRLTHTRRPQRQILRRISRLQPFHFHSFASAAATSLRHSIAFTLLTADVLGCHRRGSKGELVFAAFHWGEFCFFLFFSSACRFTTRSFFAVQRFLAIINTPVLSLLWQVTTTRDLSSHVLNTTNRLLSALTFKTHLSFVSWGLIWLPSITTSTPAQMLFSFARILNSHKHEVVQLLNDTSLT